MISVGFLTVVVTGGALSAATTQFVDKTNPTIGWHFNTAPEFPGAKGTFGAAKDRAGTLAVTCDFTGGGEAVRAIRKMDIANPVSISIDLNASASCMSWVLQDESGQNHMLNFKPTKDGWNTIKFPLVDFFADPASAPHVVYLGKWGGKNDGKWHGALKQINVTFGRKNLPKGEKTGEFQFANLVVESDGGEAAKAASAPRPKSLINPENPLEGWNFENGAEFPGAKGKMTASEKKPGAIRLYGDFTGGGECVRIIRSITYDKIGSIAFDVDTSAERVGVVLTDGSGQCHMLHFTRTVDDWNRIVIPIPSLFGDRKSVPHIKYMGKWGGKNDGKWHDPLKRIAIALGKRAFSGAKQFAIEVANVQLLPDPKTMYSFKALSSRPGALFKPDEAATVSYCLAGLAGVDVDGKWKVEARVEDVDGIVVSEFNATDAAKANGTTNLVTLAGKLPKNRYGVYDVVLTAKDATGVVLQDTAHVGVLQPGEVKPVLWIGTCTHPTHGWKPETAKVVSDIIAAAGIGIVRGGADWRFLEKKKGEYTPHAVTDLFTEQLKEKGVEPYLSLGCQGSKFYENSLDEDAFAAVCAWNAKRLKGKVKYFSLWNEPQNFGFFKAYGGGKNIYDPTSPWNEKFVTFIRKAADAIRAANPDAVIGVGENDMTMHLSRQMELGLGGKDDVYAIHPYCHGEPCPEFSWYFNDDGKSWHEKAKAAGNTGGFCFGEGGWTTYKLKDDGTGEHNKQFGNYFPMTMREQARYILRQYILARQHNVRWCCTYDFWDDGANPYYTEDNFGQIRRDWSPKPALLATRQLARTLGDAEPMGDRSPNRRVFRQYEFKLPDGRQAFASWCIKDVATVDFPSDRTFESFDMYGNKLGEGTFARIQLTADPVYHIERK